MDRNREARRASSLAATNGLSRRRQRSSSLRDSPEEDGSLELQETARLRDRTSVKKDRDRDRDHRDRERDRERDRDRSSRSKRRRGDRLMHGNHRENGNGGDESTEEESVNDDEDEDDDDGTGSLAMLPPNPPSSSISSSMSNHLHRKSFPPAAAKVYRAPPTWKAADEMIGVSVPRKARSASTKRSHECWMLGGNGGVSMGEEQVHRQASTSPVRTSLIAAASSPVAAISPPSSSNVSARKKMKPNGPKQRPPKTSSKSSSSFHQDEIEFEIAEVLYGLRQNQGPSKQEGNDSVKFDSKSRIPSPLSNSPQPHSSGIPPQSSSSSAAPLTAVVPKRKKPRPVRCEEENPEFFGVRNGGGSSTMKAEIDQAPKVEFSLTNLEKDSGSAVENGVSYGFAANSQANPPAEPPLESALKPETANSSESKPSIEATESRDAVMVKEEAPKEPTSGHRLDENCVDAAPGTKAADSTASGIENQREDKYQIDLMAPPERESEVDFDAGHPTKPAVSDVETEKMEDEKGVSLARDGVSVEEHEEKKVKTVVEESDSQKSLLNRDKMVDLQLDLERHDRDSVTAGTNKLHQQVQKQHLQSNTTEKIAQSNSSLPLPMSVASWPGGIPPMGYMGPLPGVVPMDGSAVPSMAVQPPRSIFSQPRPKRCATHCYIARNISYHQQFTRMNPFWPGASGSASLYGKPCNLNVVANTELQGSVAPVKNLNSMQDNKAQSLAIFAGQGGKDKCSQTAHAGEAAQRKQQILLQQTLPPGTPTNMLHGPAFIFPLNQQQAAAAAAAAASARSGAVKSPTPGIAASLSMSTSASVSSAPAAAAATAMSFSYPNMTANETQYLAILQNNGYPFPIPTHVGAPPPAYRGTHPQPMPFVGGSFYSSQMLHPSQQQQQPPAQPQQTQQVHQNASISSGSSSSQKNVQNQQQQQRPHGSGLSSGGSGNLQAFPTPKNHRPLQPTQQQQHQQVQQQQQHNQHMASLHQARQHDAEMGGQDSPSTADSRVSRANISVYGQNFPIPIHPSNFALMTPPSASSAGGAHGDKRQQQQQGLKPGVEPPLPSHAFAMSFASVNGAGTAPGIDISSMAQNNAILQSLPEHARHNYQIMAATAAAQVAQHKKNYRPEEGKNGAGDASSNAEEERKVTSGKASATLGQSIAFSRPDITEADNSSGNINHGSVPSRASSSISASNSHLQQRHHQHQQPLQQMLLLQKQQQQQHQQPYAAAAGRSKTAAATSNGIVYSEHLPSSSSMAAKFPNALSALPQNLVHSSSSTAQSSQWKNAPRPSTSQVASPSLPSSSTPPSLKTVPQQQVRTQQAHTQISFGGNTKSSSTTPQGQQSPSSSMLVCSPTSSVLKGGAGGSPRTGVATSTGSKTGQASTLSSSQQGKNSPSMPTRKSSPVGGRNVASSILGNHHIASSSSTGSRTQLHQQQQQQQQTHQQISKQAMHQAQLFFSHPYVQAQQADAAQAQHSSNASSTAPATSASYMQRWRPEQQQPQGPAVTLSGATTCDPAKAVAAPASKVKGGGLPSQGLIHATQFAAAAAAAAAQSSGNPLPILPAGFPYVQSIPQAVQLKPAEQKEPAA